MQYHNMMFPVQIFINCNVKIFNRISRIESFSTKLNLYFIVYLFLWCLKITNSVFCTFGEILCTYLLSLVINLQKWSRFVPSAKPWTFQNFIGWFKSLLYNKNRGPRTEPWGTPYKTEARFEHGHFLNQMFSGR